MGVGRKFGILFSVLLVLSMASMGFAAEVADDTKTQFSEISELGEQYERGEISYLQLRVKSEIVGEKIRRAISRGKFDVEVGDDHFEGISQEAMERLFGKPTEMTEWIWLVNTDRSERIDTPVPRWEFPVYDGETIKVTFNAWPQGLKDVDDQTFIFYWTGFDVWFKNQVDIDVESTVSDLSTKAEIFYNTGEGGQELVEDIIVAEKSFRSVLDESPEQCREITRDIVGGFLETNDINVINGPLYSGDNIDLIVDARMCDDCEDWRWANMYVWLEPISMDYALEGRDYYSSSRDEYQHMELSSLYIELEIAIRELVQGASIYDATKNPSFAETFNRNAGKLESISSVIDERVNQWEFSEEEREIAAIDRDTRYEQILEKYMEKFTKENLKQYDHRRELFKATETETYSYCQGEWENCDSGECEPRGNDFSCVDKDEPGVGECGPSEYPSCTDDNVRLCSDDDEWFGPSECSCGPDARSQRDIGWYDCETTTSFPCIAYDAPYCPDGTLVGGGKDPDTGCILPPVCETTTTTIPSPSGACTVRDANSNSPSKSDLDVGKGYAKQVFDGVDTIVEIKELCTDDVYDSLMDDYCYSGAKDVQWGVLLYSETGNPSVSGCAESGCEYHSCSTTLDVNDTPSGAFITGYHILDEDDDHDESHKDLVGEVCDNDGNCENNMCRGNRDGTNKFCSEALGAGESCESDWECNSEICDSGICYDSDPASWSCGNGFCEKYEVEGGLNPCSQDCLSGVGQYVGGKCNFDGICQEFDGERVDYCSDCFCGNGSCDSKEDSYSCGVDCDDFEHDSCNFDGICQGFNGEDSWDCSDCFCGNGSCDTGEDSYGCAIDCGEPDEEDYSCLTTGCHPTQQCVFPKFDDDFKNDFDQGPYCECRPGTWDCDGDYELNGCESTVECTPCQSDNDCAVDRCSADGWGIQRFSCVQGESFEYESGGFEFNGGCSVRQVGRTDGWIGFNMWGEGFDDLQDLRMSLEDRGVESWCKQDMELLIKERVELQKSLDEGFADWVFEDFRENPEDFELYGRSLGGMYWVFVDNSQRIAENMQCLDMDEWPVEAVPINLEIENEYGKIEIEERFVETDFFGERMQVLSPFMKMWMFPPKEVFKDFVKAEFREGKFGPDDEGGPSPAEVARIKQNPQIMAAINGISGSFGGDAKLLFEVVDDGETVFNMLMTVNPDVIMDVRPAPNYDGEVDARMIADLDFFYDMIITFEKDGRGVHEESPPWVPFSRKYDEKEGPDMNDIGMGIKIFTRILGGVTTGEIRVEPASAWFSVVFSLQGIIELMKIGAAFGG